MSPMKKMPSDCQDAGVQPMGGSEEAIAEPQQFFIGREETEPPRRFFFAAKNGEKQRQKTGEIIEPKKAGNWYVGWDVDLYIYIYIHICIVYMYKQCTRTQENQPVF